MPFIIDGFRGLRFGFVQDYSFEHPFKGINLFQGFGEPAFGQQPGEALNLLPGEKAAFG